MIKFSQQKCPNSLLIRIIAYLDDLEVVNSASKKRKIHKITGFYFSLANFGQVSRLRDVYPLIIVNNEDYKRHGPDKILEPLINDLKKIENGVEIVLYKKVYKVLFYVFKFEYFIEIKLAFENH